jgi:hypothetical protein
MRGMDNPPNWLAGEPYSFFCDLLLHSATRSTWAMHGEQGWLAGKAHSCFLLVGACRRLC